MKILAIEWAGPESLSAALSQAIKRISVAFYIPNSGPRFVTLWHSNGTGVRIFTEMYDIAERTEVGVLKLEPASTPEASEVNASLTSHFRGRVTAHKLVISESGTRAESGVALVNEDGDELVIVAGAYPYSLAVKGVSPLPHIFEPEYSLNRYDRVPLE